MEAPHRIQELIRLFLKLGVLAFGGPAAHIAMMEADVVSRHGWLTRQQFMDLIGATHLIPGPNSTELAIHIGYTRAGWRGLIAAGVCFILPAMLIVWTLAILYVHYQTLPQMNWLLYGVKPVILAVIVQALWRLGRTATKNIPTGIVGAAVAILALIGWHPLLLLAIAGLGLMIVSNSPRRIQRHRLSSIVPFIATALPTSLASPGATATSITLWSVFGFFLKVGSVLYGSGYVLLAFLQDDLVERWQWITSSQLLDAIAIGQITPGPVFTTATFIGYVLAGHAGALLATIGIFLPSFIFVAAVNPLLPRLRQSPWASGFLDGVNAASLGLMTAVTWKLTTAALLDWITVVMAILSCIAVFRFKLNSAWIVLGGALLGLVIHLVG
jgi:chromate transporter